MCPFASASFELDYIELLSNCEGLEWPVSRMCATDLSACPNSPNPEKQTLIRINIQLNN